jgi:hypothetical protein
MQERIFWPRMRFEGVPAGRRPVGRRRACKVVREVSDTSLLGGFDVKAHLYIYVYLHTCGTRCK